ncbi:MAG TPA: hypothetical protein VMD59_07280 [Acidimicrobiales bacterium]|nr:hypothetical protein [Acidimicrobiales bacterium]
MPAEARRRLAGPGESTGQGLRRRSPACTAPAPAQRRATRHRSDDSRRDADRHGAASRLLSEDSGWDGEQTVFHLRTPARKEIDFVSAALQGVALEGKYTEGGRWRGEAATVDASAFDGVLVTRNVLDCNEQQRAWAVPAGILAYLLDT